MRSKHFNNQSKKNNPTKQNHSNNNCNKKEGELKLNKTSKSAHHLLTETQPIAKQWLAPHGPLHPVYKLSRIFYAVEYPFASLGQLSWPCSQQAFCAAPHWQSLRDCNHWNISVLPALFSYFIQNTSLYQLLRRKWTVSQLQPKENPASCVQFLWASSSRKALTCTWKSIVRRKSFSVVSVHLPHSSHPWFLAL